MMWNMVNFEHISHAVSAFPFDFEHVTADKAVFLKTVIPIIFRSRH